MGEGTMNNCIWIGLAGGVAAFPHCLGMCGGFALHLSRAPLDHARGALRTLEWAAFLRAGGAATRSGLRVARGPPVRRSGTGLQ